MSFHNLWLLRLLMASVKMIIASKWAHLLSGYAKSTVNYSFWKSLHIQSIRVEIQFFSLDDRISIDWLAQEEDAGGFCEHLAVCSKPGSDRSLVCCMAGQWRQRPPVPSGVSLAPEKGQQRTCQVKVHWANLRSRAFSGVWPSSTMALYHYVTTVKYLRKLCLTTCFPGLLSLF